MVAKDQSDQLELLGEIVDLGHKSREKSFLHQVQGAIGFGPSAVSGDRGGRESSWAESMALYRFASNAEANLEDLREARRCLALSNAPRETTVLAIHDVTLLDYSRHNAKKDRREIGDRKGRGYEYVDIVAVDGETGQFYGVLHDTVVNDEGPDDREALEYDYEPLFAHFTEREKKRLRENHRHQMAVHLRHLAPKLSSHRIVHVADREFDDLFVLQEAVEAGTAVIVRSSALRNVQIPEAAWIPPAARTAKQGGHELNEGWTCVNLARAVDSVPLSPYKCVCVNDSHRLMREGQGKGRDCRLGIGGCRVRLYRAAKRNKKKYYKTPKPVDLKMVVVREPDPPAGVDPVGWVLFTTLPAQSLEERKRVSRYYEKRWTIEEHHRLLKSGYRIEASRLTEAEKIARLLVILTVASAIVLTLRQRLGLPAKGRLDAESYEKLRQAGRAPTNPAIDPGLRFYAMAARLGGWLGRRNDPIGPETIMRGVRRLAETFSILEEASCLVRELKDHPEIIGMFRKKTKCV